MTSTESLPQRSLEGWAVVDLLGHRRIVGRVQSVCVDGHVMLEVDQPEIRAKDGLLMDRHWNPAGDANRLIALGHKILLGYPSIYAITPVPSREHCICAFFEAGSLYSATHLQWTPRELAQDSDAVDE